MSLTQQHLVAHISALLELLFFESDFTSSQHDLSTRKILEQYEQKKEIHIVALIYTEETKKVNDKCKTIHKGPFPEMFLLIC